MVKYCTKEENFISSYTEDELKAIVNSRKNKTSVLGELIIQEGGITADII